MQYSKIINREKETWEGGGGGVFLRHDTISFTTLNHYGI